MSKEIIQGHEHVAYSSDVCPMGVATRHSYDVIECVAGRYNLVATFTDPQRAIQYVQAHETLEKTRNTININEADCEQEGAQ